MASLPISSLASLDGSSATKHGQEVKRDNDQRHKYSLGTDESGFRARPAQPMTQRRRQRVRCVNSRHASGTWSVNKLRTARPSWINREIESTDNSTDEDCYDGCPHCYGNAVDADITYSFDAPTGPSHGSEVLSTAINQALERFETKATERLVKNEYEIVRKEKESEARNTGYAADDDEYELV